MYVFVRLRVCLLQSFTGSAIDARQLINFSKKQQVEQAEQMEDIKRKMEDVLKMHGEYMKVISEGGRAVRQ